MQALHGFGDFKFPNAGLICGSKQRGWRGYSAELRSHPASEVPAICPDLMEITLALATVDDAWVERRGNGQFQASPVREGSLWLCPIGIEEDSIRISRALPQILHLYVSRERFDLLTDQASRPIHPGAIAYRADVDDELLRQLGYHILRELQTETSCGDLMADQLFTTALLHLVTHYATSDAGIRIERHAGALDRARLKRVIDYVEDNLDAPIRLQDLAHVACLSPHHFARAFRQAVGSPPHRYISTRRLDLACSMLVHSDRPIADIALHCQFSSQAAFTRAFHRAMDMTPGQYRRSRVRASILLPGGRQHE